MKAKEKLLIVKQLIAVWRANSPWSHIKTKYKLKKNELTVDFDFDNFIILTERDLQITAIAQPKQHTAEFNIGDTKMLDKIELFISDNLIE
jgi:hypothetical protein